MMRTTFWETSSFISHSSSFLILSKLPSTFSHPTVHFRAKLTPSFSTPPSYDNYANSASCGRRGLFFLSVTMPFLSLLPDYVKYFQAEAKEYGTSEYSLIQDEIRKVLSKGKAAGVLRLVFHDAGTFESSDNSGGMNGSVVYELDRPENAGLKKSLKILEKAKNVLDVKQSVSWADLIAVAGAEAVLLCGGPVIPIRVGRLDSLIPDPEGKLPEESLDAPRLKQCFQKKGFLTQELVALSGAHTLGSKGFGNPIVFDNSYYKILLEKPWRSSAEMTSMIGLPSDRALVEDDECLRSIWKQSLCYCKGKVCFPSDLPLTSLIAGASSRVLRWITEYANDQDMFFEDFKNAYIKLVNSGVSWRAS